MAFAAEGAVALYVLNIGLLSATALNRMTNQTLVARCRLSPIAMFGDALGKWASITVSTLIFPKHPVTSQYCPDQENKERYSYARMPRLTWYSMSITLSGPRQLSWPVS